MLRLTSIFPLIMLHSFFPAELMAVKKIPVKQVGQYVGCLELIERGAQNGTNSPKYCASKCAKVCHTCDVIGLYRKECICTNIATLINLDHSLGNCNNICQGSTSDICGGQTDEQPFASYFRIHRIYYDIWRATGPTNKTHYRMLRYLNGWDYSQEQCRAKGAGLAQKINADDKRFILNQVVGTLEPGWVGARRGKEGSFEWADSGEKLEQALLSDTRHDCVYLEGMKLGTEECGKKLAAICQASTDYSRFAAADSAAPCRRNVIWLQIVILFAFTGILS